MHKKLIALILFVSTGFTGFFSHSESAVIAEGAEEGINISIAQRVEGCPVPDAAAAYLCHFESGTELYAKNADTPLPMASTTKLMTALIVSELLAFDHVVIVDERSVGIEGSSIYLFEGEKITVEALMYGLLLESANDAATALACECAGSVEDFCALMNKKAWDLGLENTHFTNPHGLDDEEHYTTARELSVIAAEVLRDPRIAKIVASKNYKSPVDGGETYRYMTNHNRLLKTYEGAIGMKTGFTKRTGRCLVSAAQRDGMTLIAVTLDAHDDWSAHRNMLDFGFENYRMIRLIDSGDFDFSVECTGADMLFVELFAVEGLGIFANRNVDTEKITFEVRVNRPVFAPIAKGKVLGDVLIMYEKTPVASVELVAAGEVKAKSYNKSFAEKIKDFIRELIS